MTSDAIEEHALARIVARNAVDPFGVRELRGEVLGLAKLEIERGGFLRRDFDALVIVEAVSDGAGYGCCTGDFDDIVAYAARSGSKLLPVRDAFDNLSGASPA